MIDQPERCSTLGLSAGNSQYHKRFGLLLDYNSSVDIIKCCSVCVSMIKQKYDIGPVTTNDASNWMIPRCDECSCWLQFPDHIKLLFVPDNAYPASKLNQSAES